MEIILQILVLMKMVLDASKTNPYTNANKLANLYLMRMVLDASKSNPIGKWESIYRFLRLLE